MRLWLLTVGPALLVAASYAATWWRPQSADGAHQSRLADREASRLAGEARSQASLEQACRAAVQELATRPELQGFSTLVRPPFVLVSNLPSARLALLHDDTLAPLAGALERAYFDTLPADPVRIVLLSDEAEYRRVARGLDGYDPVHYDGYYQRKARRLVVNLSTGLGTLSHELCHAFAQRDFPNLPEWVDEGLAALHEETRFSDDKLLLVGLSNWRCRLLNEAFDAGQLPGLETVAKAATIRGRHEGLNYAFARSFCRFLQERGLLAHYYRKLRSAGDSDPTGLVTLCRLLDVEHATEVDEQFRRWLLLERASNTVASQKQR